MLDKLKLKLPKSKNLFVLFLVLIMIKSALLVEQIVSGNMMMIVAFRETLSMCTVIIVVLFLFSNNKE